MTPIETVNIYLDAFTNGDAQTARQYVADEYRFDGPMIRTRGAESYFAESAGGQAIARGHTMLHQWEDDVDVCTIYEFHTGAPAAEASIVITEWHTVRDGKLVTGRMLFDKTEFMSLMPAQL